MVSGVIAQPCSQSSISHLHPLQMWERPVCWNQGKCSSAAPCINHVGSSLIPPRGIYMFNLLLLFFFKVSHKCSCLRRSCPNVAAAAQPDLFLQVLVLPLSQLPGVPCSHFRVRRAHRLLQYEGKLLRQVVYFKWHLLAVIWILLQDFSG